MKSGEENHVLNFLLEAVAPALPPDKAAEYAEAFLRKGVDDVGTICYMDKEGLREVGGVTDPVHVARILKAAAQTLAGHWREAVPRPAGGGPLVVRPKMGMQRISEIDNITGVAEVKFYFDFYWEDPLLIGQPAGALATYAWRPDFSITNAKGDMSKTCLNDPPVLVDPSSGKVLCAYLVSGSVQNSATDLKSFPYDQDDLDIKILQDANADATQWVMRTCTPEQSSINIQFDHRKEMSEWDLRGMSIHAAEIMGGNGVQYSMYTVSFHVLRKHYNYIWQVVMPIIMCTFFCFSCFFYDTDGLEARNGTSLTMFLATSALLLVVGASLPKTDFLTRIDKFVIGSILTQFVVGVEAWILSVLHGHDKVEEAEQVDRVASVALPVCFLLMVTYFFVGAELKDLTRSERDPPPYLASGVRFYSIAECGVDGLTVKDTE